MPFYQCQSMEGNPNENLLVLLLMMASAGIGIGQGYCLPCDCVMALRIFGDRDAWVLLYGVSAWEAAGRQVEASSGPIWRRRRGVA